MLSLMKPGEQRIFFRRVIRNVDNKAVALSSVGSDLDFRHTVDGGVRLYVDFDVPEEFVLTFPGDGIIVQETTYRVIWRRGHEIGCKFVSAIRRPRFAMRDK